MAAKPSVLIFGADGMLGRECVRAFREAGWKITKADRAEADITQLVAVERLVRRIRPRVVINAAAVVQVDWCETHPSETWAVNALGAGNVAHAVAVVAPKATLIHVSTSDVFGGPGTHAVTERPSPVNVYGWSKYAGEELVREELAKHRAPYFIIRTGWLYSEFRKTFVDVVAESLLAGKPLEVIADQYNIPTWAHELSQVFVDVAEHPGRFSRGPVHMTAYRGKRASKYEIASHIARVLGKKTSLLKKMSTSHILTAPRPPSAVLRPSKLGLLPPWQQSLETYLSQRYGS